MPDEHSYRSTKAKWTEVYFNIKKKAGKVLHNDSYKRLCDTSSPKPGDTHSPLIKGNFRELVTTEEPDSELPFFFFNE